MTVSPDQAPSLKSNEENAGGGGSRPAPSHDDRIKNTSNAPFGPSLSNLSSPSLGARILFATDEWFASADNLLLDSDPVFVPDLFCEQGKVMDGWETRRKRTAGHDWCVLKLGGNGSGGGGGEIRGLEIDTAHFTGNHVPQVSVEVATIEPTDDDSCDSWCPGAQRRLERGGGTRGTGASPTFAESADAAVRGVATWTEILPRTPLEPGYDETRMHLFTIGEDVRRRAGGRRVTHVRVNYYPDGGIARLRLWGVPVPAFGDASSVAQPFPRSSSVTAATDDAVRSGDGNLLTLPPRLDGSDDAWTAHSAAPYPHPELSSSVNGGVGLECSNRHYGVPSNLVRPSYGQDMGDGWETARHPDRPPVWVKDAKTGLIESPLMDWAVLKLGRGGTRSGVSRVILDTRHFRGNYPESVMVEGCHCPHLGDDRVCAATPEDEETLSPGEVVEWFPLVPRTRAGPDAEHVYLRSGVKGPGVVGGVMNGTRPATHVRVRIYPDGGLSRVRVYGEASEGGVETPGEEAAPQPEILSHL